MESAIENVKKIVNKLNIEEKKQLYKYYKQATCGDNNTPRPGCLNFKDKAKWDEWNSLKGVDKELAEKVYIELVKKFLDKYEST